MKITKAKLKQIIREALHESLPSDYGHDDEWAAEEELADDADYADGVEDAKAGKPIRKDASPAYLEGWAEGGGKVLNETDELQQQLAVLNAKADAAREAGDREAYDALVDQMIELENTHLDAGGELPLPKNKDQEDDIIARFPDPEGKNPDQVIYQWQQDEFDERERAYKAFNQRNKK